MRHLLRPGGAACTALLLSLYARAEPTGGDCHVGSRRIKALAAAGRPITLALFPHAEHGLTEYEFNAAGDRVSPRYAAGYFAMMRDFIRDGRLQDACGANHQTCASHTDEYRDGRGGGGAKSLRPPLISIPAGAGRRRSPAHNRRRDW